MNDLLTVRFKVARFCTMQSVPPDGTPKPEPLEDASDGELNGRTDTYIEAITPTKAGAR